jgi:hypothetical protein
MYHKELNKYIPNDNANSNQKEKLVKQMIPGAVNHTTFSVWPTKLAITRIEVQ